jgi:hypothetical protein
MWADKSKAMKYFLVASEDKVVLPSGPPTSLDLPNTEEASVKQALQLFRFQGLTMLHILRVLKRIGILQ